LLGAISLGRFNWREWRAEVGYWLVPAARGRGVATQSVRMVARWAFEELGLVRLELLAHPDNVRSQAVAERSGFLREGRVRSYRRSPQGRSDMVLYSLLPGDMAVAAAVGRDPARPTDGVVGWTRLGEGVAEQAAPPR
jgi:RimJ/RimL family protein N-acetyltransferase